MNNIFDKYGVHEVLDKPAQEFNAIDNVSSSEFGEKGEKSETVEEFSQDEKPKDETEEIDETFYSELEDVETQDVFSEEPENDDTSHDDLENDENYFESDDYEYVENPEDPNESELQKIEKTLWEYVRKYGWRFVSYVSESADERLIRVQEVCVTECEKLLKETLGKYCVQDKRKTYKTERTLKNVLRVFEKGFVIEAINRSTLSSGLKNALLKKLETIVLDKRPPLGFILKKIERQKETNREFFCLEALWKGEKR